MNGSHISTDLFRFCSRFSAVLPQRLSYRRSLSTASRPTRAWSSLSRAVSSLAVSYMSYLHCSYEPQPLLAAHPVHLHGHAFSVVRSAGNSTYNFVNPPQRDVVSIGTTTNDRTTIRFFTDNPGAHLSKSYNPNQMLILWMTGPWFFHCHIGSSFTLSQCFSLTDIRQTGT